MKELPHQESNCLTLIVMGIILLSMHLNVCTLKSLYEGHKKEDKSI